MADSLHSFTIDEKELKKRLYDILDFVNHNKVEYVITKNGIPISKLIPIMDSTVSPFGYLKDTVTYMGNIIDPINTR